MCDDKVRKPETWHYSRLPDWSTIEGIMEFLPRIYFTVLYLG